MNRTIYVYWYGDESKKNDLYKKYDEINKKIYPWKIELGPSDEEHDYLLKTFKYYKKSFDLSIYALCSDVYRSYKIYQNGGLYMDAGCKINIDNFKHLLSLLEKKNYMFVFERPYYFWNGMFWFKNANDKILKNCLNYMEDNYSNNFDHTIIMPIFFSKFIFKKKGYIIENNKDILLLKSKDLDWEKNIGPVSIHPSASWWNKINKNVKRKYSCLEGWKKSFSSFKKKEIIFSLNIKRRLYTSFIINKLYTYKYIYKVISKIIG